MYIYIQVAIASANMANSSDSLYGYIYILKIKTVSQNKTNNIYKIMYKSNC